MKLENLRISKFRNADFASLNFTGTKTFFFGENGQGKTNLLEALSLLTALRSFRTRDARQLVFHGENQALIALSLAHEIEGKTELILKISAAGTKSVELGSGTPIIKMSEFVGRFPTVVFSSDDILLIRGAPTLRRRWFDVLFSALDSAYLLSLQRFYKALESRNKILKSRENLSETAKISCRAFEKILAETGAFLQSARERGIAELNEEFSKIAEKILDVPAASPRIFYASNLNISGGVPEFEKFFESTRNADKILGSTQKGIHRDDYSFKIFGKNAADFASEGQQRGIALALSLAQLSLFRKKSKIAPIVLADDVLNELDPKRRENFWREIGDDFQILATGTTLPKDAKNWQIYAVKNGTYEEWTEQNLF